MVRFFRLLVMVTLAVLALCGPMHAQETPVPAIPATLPTVMDVRVSATPERARLVIDLGTQTQFSLTSLGGPDRLAIDVRAGAITLSKPDGTPSGEGMVSSYSVRQIGPDRVRTMLTLSAPAQVQQAYVLDPLEDQPARLVVDIIPTTAAQFATNVHNDLAAASSVTPPLADITTAAEDSALASVSKPLVVIDPGHGGIDGGAEAPSGVKEKDIVLAFCLRLQELLVESGRFDVALTRSDDSYLKLEERVALARTNKAALFVSIHADSFQQPEIRGASVYTRDENATDVLDKVLADGENRSDVVAGYTMPQTAPAVVDILVDLMRREMRVHSFMAARAIVDSMKPSVELRRYPVRQADFLVLQAPDVPSVLIELGFLSNAQDMANLRASDWQERTAGAVARGISAYFDELKPQD